MMPTHGSYNGEMFSDHDSNTIIINDTPLEYIEAIEVEEEEEIYFDDNRENVTLSLNSPLIGGEQELSNGYEMRYHHSPPRTTIIECPPNDPQYDDDIHFQGLIAAKLADLDEKSKAIMKLDIQKILTDARFGLGASAARLNRDNEQILIGEESSHSQLDDKPIHKP